MPLNTPSTTPIIPYTQIILIVLIVCLLPPRSMCQHLFAAAYLLARDAMLEAFVQEHPGSEVLEERALQNTREVFVDTVKQIEAIEAALGV
jgi:hypothetical protein